MKKHILRLLIGAAVLTSTAYAQYTPSDTKQLLDGQNYVFEARWMSPLGSGSRQLTSPYFLTVTKDSVVADLPYSGKNNSANGDESTNGIRFTSTKFTYSDKPGKTSWGISIQPKDDTDGSQLYLKVSGDGSATLSVNSNSKDRISYSGFVRPK